MGFPDEADPDDPAEVWVGPGLSIEYALTDSDGHPLTWGRVASAHDFLTRHATCAGQAAVPPAVAAAASSSMDPHPYGAQPLESLSTGSSAQGSPAPPSPDVGATGYDSGYDSGGDPCPCTWHPVMIEAAAGHRMDVDAWPGQVCGVCWAASCVCGYVFDDVQYAHSRWPSGRPRCASCAP